MPERRKARARHSTHINLDTLQAQNVKPQVVLTNLGLQSTNGLCLVATLTRELPHNEVVGMGLVTSQIEILEFVQGGSAGKKKSFSPADGIASHPCCRPSPSERGEEDCPMECGRPNVTRNSPNGCTFSVYTVKGHIHDILEEIALTGARKSRHFPTKTKGFDIPSHFCPQRNPCRFFVTHLSAM
jgi:hypothetical protein